MSKLTDHDDVRKNALGESDEGVAALQSSSQNFEDHGRLAVFVENSDTTSYFSRSKNAVILELIFRLLIMP